MDQQTPSGTPKGNCSSRRNSFASIFSTPSTMGAAESPPSEVAIDALSVIGCIGDLAETRRMPKALVFDGMEMKNGNGSAKAEALTPHSSTSTGEFAVPDNGGSILAIAGCTNGGKTTLAKMLRKLFLEENATVALIHQDTYFYEPEKVEKIFHGKSNGKSPTEGFYYNYDVKEAIDKQGLINAIAQASAIHDYVIVEGNMLTEWEEVVAMCDRVIFLTMNQETCRRRRATRHYDPPDPEGYFDDVAWPAYQRHLQRALALAREDRRISFFDVSSRSDDVNEEALLGLIRSMSDDVVRICFDPLDVDEVMRIINTPSCGATSMFVGTTRDTFEGRGVERLDYESYDEMAYKELRRVCAQAHEKFPSVERVVIYHRIGEVPVTEISVIIATASPHRKDAMHACEFAIDELKKTVPIWKKEVYDDGGCSWKENGEWDPSRKGGEPTSIEEKSFAKAQRRRDANRDVFWLRQFMRQVNLQSEPKNEKPTCNS